MSNSHPRLCHPFTPSLRLCIACCNSTNSFLSSFIWLHASDKTSYNISRSIFSWSLFSAMILSYNIQYMIRQVTNTQQVCFLHYALCVIIMRQTTHYFVILLYPFVSTHVAYYVCNVMNFYVVCVRPSRSIVA